MKLLTHPWPRSLPYRLTDRIGIKKNWFEGMSPYERQDAQAEIEAQRLLAREESIVNTGLAGLYLEPFYCQTDFTAFANSAAEGSLLSGNNILPTIPAGHFAMHGNAFKFILLEAMGVFSTTSTPTLTFQARISTTGGASTLSGSSLGVSGAITTGNGVGNVQWLLWLKLVCTAGKQGTGNATLAGAGFVRSPAGFAAPYEYSVNPTTPPTATWTQTFDAALVQYINLSVTWSAASASNSIQCKQLTAYMS